MLYFQKKTGPKPKNRMAYEVFLEAYHSDLVSREWRSADGVTASVYRPPGLFDDITGEPVNNAYSNATLCESEGQEEGVASQPHCNLPWPHLQLGHGGQGWQTVPRQVPQHSWCQGKREGSWVMSPPPSRPRKLPSSE